VLFTKQGIDGLKVASGRGRKLNLSEQGLIDLLLFRLVISSFPPLPGRFVPGMNFPVASHGVSFPANRVASFFAGLGSFFSGVVEADIRRKQKLQVHRVGLLALVLDIMH
jgi:hypothetical protein